MRTTTVNEEADTAPLAKYLTCFCFALKNRLRDEQDYSNTARFLSSDEFEVVKMALHKPLCILMFATQWIRISCKSMDKR